jgi:hypothetical protein
MKNINCYNRWKNHLSENNMAYCEHFRFAISHGFRCIQAGLYLIIHALLPCFFKSAGSDLIHKLDQSFIEWRSYEKNYTDKIN